MMDLTQRKMVDLFPPATLKKLAKLGIDDMSHVDSLTHGGQDWSKVTGLTKRELGTLQHHHEMSVTALPPDEQRRRHFHWRLDRD